MMNKEQKQNYIKEMTAQFENSEAVLVTHYQGLTVKQLDDLRKKMRVSPDDASISFDTKNKEGENIQVGKEVYRTKGNAKSILAHLGKDIQDCLKKKATEQ